MLSNYLKVAIRNLLRFRLYTLINVLGLAMGMAFCALAWLFASTEWSFDRFHENGDRIYRAYAEGVRSNGDRFRAPDYMPVALGPALVASSPEVERAVRLVSAAHPSSTSPDEQFVRVSLEGQASDEEFLLADPGFLEVFTFPLARGDSHTALRQRNSVVLSHELAQRLFGGDDPMGRRLTIRSKAHDAVEDYEITGVAAPIPKASSIRFNLLLPFRNVEFLFAWDAQAWEHTCNAYVVLEEGATQADAAPELAALVQDHMLEEGLPLDSLHMRLQPLTDLHSDTGMMRWIGHGTVPPTSPVVSYVLATIALAVLLMGSINFINLAVGRAAWRASEVGVRKAVGGNQRQLVWQFLGEACALTAISLAAGLALAEAALPAFNAFAGRELSLDLTDPAMFGAVVALVVVVSLGAGLYPALVMSGLRPLHAMQKQVSVGGPTTFTRWLVGFQLALSIGLITCALVMSSQLGYIQARDLGFDQERVVLVDTDPLRELNPQHPLLIERFRTHSRISHVSSARYAFMTDDSWGVHTAQTQDGREAEVHQYFVDHDFVQVMGMELVAGRDFSRERGEEAGVAIVTETMARRMGWEDPLGQEFGFDKGGAGLLYKSEGKVRVIGVVRDFTMRSRLESAPPGVLLLNPSLGPSPYEAKVVLVRILPGDFQEVLQFMQETWDEIVPDADFRFSFLQQDIEQYYREDRRWRNLVAWASACAVTIAALGAFALTALAAGRRTKEIGIRKVLGATTAGITAMLSREFATLAAAGAVLACPVAYWIMSRWLEGFAYRIELSVWYFAAGGVLALVGVALSAGYQAIRAALANPIEALRYE